MKFVAFSFCAGLSFCGTASLAQDLLAEPGEQAPATTVELPSPSEDPLVGPELADPVLTNSLATTDPSDFRETIQKAVARHPALDEASGYAQEARFALYESRAATHPSAEINITGFQVLARDFSSAGVDNIVERTRASRRFDQFASINQLLTDFGATSNRIRAAGDALRAASLGVDDAASRIALNAIAAWYDVFALRAILSLSQSYRADQEFSRQAIAQRIAEGASARVDLALVENSLAQLDIRIAQFRQQLSTAEARYREITGQTPPAVLPRAPVIGIVPDNVEAARILSAQSADVRAAVYRARAAEREAKAARRDLLPVVTTSVAAGRYGLLETERDYDVVAQVSLRQRFFGGLPQRARSREAGAFAAGARADRIREESARDAALAFSEFQSLGQQLEALEKAYVATRQTRDAVFERFRYSRGTLFETIDASDAFYSAATGYLQVLAQRDAARYVLLARTGGLLDALRINPYSPTPSDD